MSIKAELDLTSEIEIISVAIDRAFSTTGFAVRHPELVGACIQAAAIDRWAETLKGMEVARVIHNGSGTLLIQGGSAKTLEDALQKIRDYPKDGEE